MTFFNETIAAATELNCHAINARFVISERVKQVLESCDHPTLSTMTVDIGSSKTTFIDSGFDEVVFEVSIRRCQTVFQIGSQEFDYYVKSDCDVDSELLDNPVAAVITAMIEEMGIV